MNPSFESYTACPSALGEITKAKNWQSFWGSPEYYNNCSLPGPFSLSTPRNYAGFQMPAHGVAYVGIVCYNSWIPNAKEFLAQKLAVPLNIGSKYFISFMVSLALRSQTDFNCATDKIGATFSMDYYSPFTFIRNSAAVYKNSVITDTTNWTNIFGSFIADSAYTYIVFGNFFDDAHTNVKKYFPSSALDQSYYYLDDIRLSTDSSFVVNNATKLNKEVKSEYRLKIFPNPAIESFTVEHDGFCNVKLMTIEGVCVFTKDFSNTLTVDCANFPDGLYFVQVQSGSSSYCQKVLFRHY